MKLLTRKLWSFFENTGIPSMNVDTGKEGLYASKWIRSCPS